MPNIIYLAFDDFEDAPPLLARTADAMYCARSISCVICLVATVSLPAVDVGDPDNMHLVIGCLLVRRYDAGDGPILHAVVGVVGRSQALEPVEQPHGRHSVERIL